MRGHLIHDFSTAVVAENIIQKSYRCGVELQSDRCKTEERPFPLSSFTTIETFIVTYPLPKLPSKRLFAFSNNKIVYKESTSYTFLCIS